MFFVMQGLKWLNYFNHWNNQTLKIHQTILRLTQTCQEGSSWFSDMREQNTLMVFYDQTNNMYNARTSRPWLQGALRIQNHSLVYLPSDQKLLHNLCEVRNKLQNSENPFLKKYLCIIWWLKAMFNVFFTMRAHVYIGLGI